MQCTNAHNYRSALSSVGGQRWPCPARCVAECSQHRQRTTWSTRSDSGTGRREQRRPVERNYATSSDRQRARAASETVACACNTIRPSLSVRALVRVCVSVTIITRRGRCGFCPSFVTTIYTRAHRRWWRVSTV